MSAARAGQSVYADWQARRARLLGSSPSVPQYCDIQLHVFDFLLHRYRDAPAAAAPARQLGAAPLVTDERAIVVHQHLGRGQVAGIKSPEEAYERMEGLLHRLVAHATRETSPADEAATAAEDDTAHAPGAGFSLAELSGSGNPMAAIRGSLKKSAELPEPAVKYLRMQVVDASNLGAARLLAQCSNPSVPQHAMLAWRALVAGGRHDELVESLDQILCQPQFRTTAQELVRAELASPDAPVRVAAAALLGKIGDLHDVALLSDLLALPVAADEHARERAALVHAMQQISGLTTRDFQLADDQPLAREDIGIVRPEEEWTCMHCGTSVPETFDICWACGTSSDGLRRIDFGSDAAEEE